jgi:hypothetical protein
MNEEMPVLRLRWCLLAIAAVAILAGASGQLSNGLSTALWLPSVLVLACDPASPVRRAVGRGLHIPVDRSSPTPYDQDAPAA